MSLFNVTLNNLFYFNNDKFVTKTHNELTVMDNSCLLGIDKFPTIHFVHGMNNNDIKFTKGTLPRLKYILFSQVYQLILMDNNVAFYVVSLYPATFIN
jgi:hypothetical protein